MQYSLRFAAAVPVPHPSRAPVAVAKEPARLYQAKVWVRLASGYQLGERRLLDGQEWTDLIAGWADHPNDRRHHQEDEVAGQAEDQPCHDHQQRPDDQHLAPAHPVSRCGEPQRDSRIAQPG